MMTGGLFAPGLGSLTFGLDGPGGPPPPPPPIPHDQLPEDLPAAIKARFARLIAAGTPASAVAAALTEIHKDDAGDRPIAPYLVFKITAGGPILTTDIHYVYDQRVTFTVHADTQQEADRIRDRGIKPGLGTASGTYEFQDGFSIPFFQVDNHERKEPGRGPRSAYRHSATVVYSARTHRS